MGGVQANVSNAIEYYKRGAAKNDRDAKFNLGLIYERKMISAVNQKDRDHFRQLARRWFEEAAGQGVIEARERMRKL